MRLFNYYNALNTKFLDSLLSRVVVKRITVLCRFGINVCDIIILSLSGLLVLN